MKAMFMSDLLIAKKYLLQQSIIGVAVGLFISVIMGNLYIVVPAVGVMIPFSIAFTILAYDERDNWEQFRLSLPISRAGVILGRYASLAVIALGGLVLGLLTTGVLIAAATIAPGVPQLADLMVNFSWQAIVFTGAIAVGIILLMLTLTMPLVARFGMTKAVRFIPLGLIVIVMLLFSAGDGMGAPEFLIRLGAWIQTPEGTLGMAGIVIAASCALYALSGALATRLYAKREF